MHGRALVRGGLRHLSIYLHDVRPSARDGRGSSGWSSWAGVMHGRLPCVGHADSGMLRTGDPAGLGRLRRDRVPGVRPRSVSYCGRRAGMGGGVMGGDGLGWLGGDGFGWLGGRAELDWWSTFAEWL